MTTTDNDSSSKVRFSFFILNDIFFLISNVTPLPTLFIEYYECDLSKNVKSTINIVLERRINNRGTLSSSSSYCTLIRLLFTLFLSIKVPLCHRAESERKNALEEEISERRKKNEEKENYDRLTVYILTEPMLLYALFGTNSVEYVNSIFFF